jgi:hypothetical protein
VADVTLAAGDRQRRRAGPLAAVFAMMVLALDSAHPAPAGAGKVSVRETGSGRPPGITASPSRVPRRRMSPDASRGDFVSTCSPLKSAPLSCCFSCFTALIAMACKSLAAVSLLAAVRPRL